MTDCIPGLFRSCARFLPERGRDWMETRAATHGYAPFRGGSEPGVLPLRKGAYLIRRTVQPYAAGHRRRSPGGFGRSGKDRHSAGSNLPALRLSPPSRRARAGCSPFALQSYPAVCTTGVAVAVERLPRPPACQKGFFDKRRAGRTTRHAAQI